MGNAENKERIEEVIQMDGLLHLNESLLEVEHNEVTDFETTLKNLHSLLYDYRSRDNKLSSTSQVTIIFKNIIFGILDQIVKIQIKMMSQQNKQHGYLKKEVEKFQNMSQNIIHFNAYQVTAQNAQYNLQREQAEIKERQATLESKLKLKAKQVETLQKELERVQAEINDRHTTFENIFKTKTNQVGFETLQYDPEKVQTELNKKKKANFNSKANQVQKLKQTVQKCIEANVDKREQLEQTFSSFPADNLKFVENRHEKQINVGKKLQNNQVETNESKVAQTMEKKEKILCIMGKKNSYLEATQACISSFAEKRKSDLQIISKRIGAFNVPIAEFCGAEFVILVAVPEPRGLILTERGPNQLFAAYNTAVQHQLKTLVILCLPSSENSALNTSDVLHQSCDPFLQNQPLLENLHEQRQLISVVYDEYGKKQMTLTKSQESLLSNWLHKDDSESILNWIKSKRIPDSISEVPAGRPHSCPGFSIARQSQTPQILSAKSFSNILNPTLSLSD